MKPTVGGVRDQHPEIGVETTASQQKTASTWSKRLRQAGTFGGSGQGP